MLRKIVHFFLKIYIHFFIGTNVSGEKETFPKKGPALIVANHNSHMDTAVILSLFSCKEIKNIYTVGAADYFFKNKMLAWVSRNVFGLIPLNRNKVSTSIFEGVYSALDNGSIVLIFPEGSRGEPGKIGSIKKGIAKIAENYKSVPIFPIKLTRTENVLPKGRLIPLPFIISLELKKEIYYTTSEELLESIRQSFL